MKLALVASLGVSAVCLLTGCPSKDNTSSSGAAAPSVSASASAPAASTSGTAPTGSPLATLDASKAATEAWTASEGGQALSILYWADSNIRLSATCKQADGSLSCAALTQLKGTPIDVRGGHGSMSMGTKACLKLGNKLVRGKNATGAEDGFCQFSDGSLVSTGTLEQYAVNTASTATP